MIRELDLSLYIGLDKSGNQVNSFLITGRKHMFSSSNMKYIDTFWWEKASYQELWSILFA